MNLFDNNVKCEFIKTIDDKIVEALLVITPNNKEFNPIEWLKENKLKIETYLHRFGGILFREFGLYSVSEFNKVVQSICPQSLRLRLSFNTENKTWREDIYRNRISFL